MGYLLSGWDIDEMPMEVVGRLIEQFQLQEQAVFSHDGRARFMQLYEENIGKLCLPALGISLAERLMNNDALFLSPDPFINESFYFGMPYRDRRHEVRKMYDHHRCHAQQLLKLEAKMPSAALTAERIRLEKMTVHEGQRILTHCMPSVLIAPADERASKIYGALVKINCDTGDRSIRPLPQCVQYHQNGIC